MNAVVQSIHAEGSSEAQRAEIKRIFALQQNRALQLRTSTTAERIAKLEMLRDTIADNLDAIREACYADFKKPSVEVDFAEVSVIQQEANHTIKHLKKWMKTRKVHGTLSMAGTTGWVRYEPKGVCLIIAPWNYPVNLMFGPLICAIAGGNTAILKPSELTPNVSALTAKLVRQMFSEDEVAIFEGDASTSQALLELPFDHTFFTGSPAVGKIVMAAAAKHLTSVTLELGGKSPVVIDETANLAKAARSLSMGKFQNAGQTCIAPDYVFVHESVHDEFVHEMKTTVQEFYGDSEADRKATADFPRIVNERHAGRVKSLIDSAVESGAKVEYGGETDLSTSYIAPTLLTAVSTDSDIMRDEIFGPVMPVLKYSDLQQPINHINNQPKPLALYVYSQNQENIDRVIENTSSGDSAINTCMMHFAHPNLPFGGANNSGIGKSGGIYGFKAFSHERAILRNRYSSISMLAPPYNDKVKRLVAFMMRWLF